MRSPRRDPNITPEIRAARQAMMAERAVAMKERAAHAEATHGVAVELAKSMEQVGPPMTAKVFEAELDRRDAEAAARAPDQD